MADKEAPKSELANILPEFVDESGSFSLPSSSVPPQQQQTASSEEPSTVEIPPEAKYIGAGAIGAGAGYKYGSVQQPPSQLVTGRANLSSAQAGLEEARRQASLAGSNVGSQIDQLKIQLDVARSEMDAARQAYELARKNAERLGALPETLSVINVPSGAAPGTSASPEGLSQGALRHSAKMGEISEANVVRKGAAPLTAYTQSSRLIVPNELADAPIYNALQKSAQAELAAAEQALQNAIKNLGVTQSQWQKVSGTTPPVVTNAATKVAQKEIQAAQAAARLAELEKAYPGFGKFATALGKSVNIAGGGLSGAEFMNAYEKAQEGKWVDAISSGAAGLGGALMLGGPRSKAIGTVLAAPALATQIPELYKEYVHPRIFPEKSVMEE